MHIASMPAEAERSPGCAPSTEAIEPMSAPIPSPDDSPEH